MNDNDLKTFELNKSTLFDWNGLKSCKIFWQTSKLARLSRNLYNFYFVKRSRSRWTSRRARWNDPNAVPVIYRCRRCTDAQWDCGRATVGWPPPNEGETWRVDLRRRRYSAAWALSQTGREKFLKLKFETKKLKQILATTTSFEERRYKSTSVIWPSN